MDVDTTSTSTSTTSGASASATCTGNRWILPVQDVACALPATGNYTSIMDKCCAPAAVTKYNDGCDMYCLAQGHSMGELLNCIKENGGNKDVFCGGQLNATATASLSSTASSTGTGTKTGASASATGHSGAGGKPVSVLGVGLLVLVVCGMVV
ncbi:hypothetical protein Aspvir_003467 [Aspergillus viridinutans]|uniref:Uncharacterized protein n=1 Tax=Aspergillus viridinutans TaxID=75553 RepID=A0A9P3FAI8_ASPVI|nr:uncharacterized protein Aspvir_003467 [Aspergillus viridinutans]GIK07798.1 hypothetical protein Aspvir_003467 [Aspergillus viridinutans]